MKPGRTWGSYFYPKRHQMRLNSLAKRKEVGNKCQSCGQPDKSFPPYVSSLDVHHIDMKKDNHDLSNLQVLCRKCHASLHAKANKGMILL